MIDKIKNMEEEILINGEAFKAHSNKVLYWVRTKTLLVSDPHFGKVNHFRKNGIPIPGKLMENNFYRLGSSIDYFKPDRVLFLGDLFHSEKNEEWELLKEFFEDYGHIQFDLVLGNHDILTKYELSESRLNCFEQLIEDPFIFTHFPLEDHKGPLHNFCGHVHPGVRLKGGPGQSARLPCFYFSKVQSIMPAFGDFTGSMRIQPKKNDRVVVIAGDELLTFTQESKSAKKSSSLLNK